MTEPELLKLIDEFKETDDEYIVVSRKDGVEIKI